MATLHLVNRPALGAQLLALWASLPTAQAPDTRLRALPQAEWDRLPPRRGHTGYYDAQGIALLRLADNPQGRDGYLSVAVHEMFHHLYWGLLTDQQRREWNRFWRAHKKQMPDEYSLKNAEEGFCEAGEWLYHRPEGAAALAGVVAEEVRGLLGVSP